MVKPPVPCVGAVTLLLCGPAEDRDRLGMQLPAIATLGRDLPDPLLVQALGGLRPARELLAGHQRDGVAPVTGELRVRLDDRVETLFAGPNRRREARVVVDGLLLPRGQGIV